MFQRTPIWCFPKFDVPLPAVAHWAVARRPDKVADAVLGRTTAAGLRRHHSRLPDLFLFSVFGPYGYVGSSYFALIEAQTHHIVRCLKRARQVGATRVEVTEEANDRYFAEMIRRRHHQVFWLAGQLPAG